MTGFYRDGCCNTGREDVGSHTICALMTSAFLDFSKSHGNDLSTPMLDPGFPGLNPGDRWCLCTPRWQEAFEANQAPRVVLRATMRQLWLTVCSPISNALQWTWLDSALISRASNPARKSALLPRCRMAIVRTVLSNLYVAPLSPKLSSAVHRSQLHLFRRPDETLRHNP